MYDVIVIGGGPAGSRAARRLAENGHTVLVLEKRPGAGQKLCCTGIIGLECVNTFEIDDSVILKKINSATLFSPSGKALYLRREEPQAVILDRPAFDKLMAARAQRAGAEYRFNSRVLDAAIQSDHTEVTVADKAKSYQIPAKAIVIASGFAPGLNGRLGLGGYTDFTTGVQAEVAAPGLEETGVYFGDMAPGFFGWLAPTGKGAGKAGLLSRKHAGPLLKKWLDRLAEQGKIRSADVKICYGGIPLKPPARTCGERMVAVGDAAGQVKPTSGGGIYYGLIGAEIGAEVLHKALNDDDLSAKRLARYERAWRRKLGGELRTGYRARKLFERMSERQIDRLFEIVKAGGIDKALLEAEGITFDWHGGIIKSLFKYQLVTRFLKIIKPPSGAGRFDR